MKALLGVSERRACRVLEHPRSTQRYKPIPVEDEKALTEEIAALASQVGRYFCRRITALPRHRGWRVNHKRVERICRSEGLKAPVKQPKRGRLWFNDGSCVRLRPAWKDHVRAFDFVHLIRSCLPTLSPCLTDQNNGWCKHRGRSVTTASHDLIAILFGWGYNCPNRSRFRLVGNQ